jgi:vancomycin resistance protein YoaR
VTVDQPQVLEPRNARSGGTRPPARPPARRSFLSLFAAAFVVVTVISGLAVWAAQVVLEQSYRGRVFPGVSIRGVAVGDLARDAARAAVEARYAAFLAQPVVLSYDGRSWMPTLAELGVTLEIDQAVDAALAAGRGNPLAELRALPLLGGGAVDIPLQLTVDQVLMQQYLVSRVSGIERPAIDARLLLDGTSVSWTPASAGTQLLLDEMVLELTSVIESLDQTTLAVRTRSLDPVLTDAAAQAAQQQIASLLAGPLVLNVDDDQFVWSVEDLARLVRVEQTDDPSTMLAVSIDQAQLRDKITAIADATESAGKLPRLSWNGGNLRIAQPGEPGRRIAVDQVLEQINQALNQPAEQRALQLVRAEVPSPITEANLATLGITQLLGVGRSDFKGSAAYRITNIEAGMRLLDGVLIAPGEEFSFNSTIGSIDESNGFVEGYAIIQNRTQLEWGGGICQDSTTVFRAAFWAGLPITERWGHSFYISWYDKYGFAEYGDGPGMDATIFTGGPDLKFLNDTGNWLLMESSVDKSRNLAEIRLYGTDTGRSVELVGPVTRNRTPAPTEPVYVAVEDRPVGSPRQSDTARGGMEIIFTRIVKQNGAEIERREFLTRFRPWPDIFEYNPADLGPDGKPRPSPTPEPTADPQLSPTPLPTPLPTPVTEDTAQQGQPSDG